MLVSSVYSTTDFQKDFQVWIFTQEFLNFISENSVVL